MKNAGLKLLPFFILALGCSSQTQNAATEETPETIDVPALETYTPECATGSAVAINPADLADQDTNSAQSSLDCRVNYENRAVALSGGSNAAALGLDAVVTPSLSLRLVATIDPPMIDGTTLGATDVYSIGDRAVVTYNTAGSGYFGALQIVDMHNPLRPRLISESIFKTRDISSSLLDGSILYMTGAQAVEDTGFEEPAQIFTSELDGNLIPLGFFDPAPLPSYVGTDLALANGNLYATTGDDGGLVKLNARSLERENFVELDDARSLVYDEKRLYVFQGTPGRLSVVDPDTFAATTYELGGAGIEQSKGTIEADGRLLFIGDGDGGALIVSPETGNILETIANPVEAGLDPSLTVANAVTVEDHLLFISNGEAGIRAASWEGSDPSVKTAILGTLNFGENISANDVAYRGDYLMVAAGRGGLKIVKVIRSPYVSSSPCESVTALFCDDFNQVDGFQINDNLTWDGGDGSSHPSATVIAEGARINKNKSVTTYSSFDPTTVGKHHSVKLLKSGIVTVHWEKDKNYGIQVRYDGGKTVTAYIGKVNSTKQRKTVNFTLPGSVPYFVAHVYQQGSKVQVSLELEDGTVLTSDVLSSTEAKLLDPQAVRLETYDGSDQPADAPSFDNVLVEDFSF